jgi:nucleoside-diphosphate-sugar epimerase
LKSVLVTGGTGFIGSHLVDALLSKHYKIYCIVRNFNKLKWLEDKPVEFIKSDLSSSNITLPEVDYIYHLAGLTKARKKKEFYSVNYLGTKNLIDAVRKSKKLPKGFFLLSTLAVNGNLNSSKIINEDPASPESHYAKSKWLAEQEILKYKDILNTVIIRPTIVYGPRDKDLYSYFKLIKKKNVAPIFNKDAIFSFLYIADLINMLLLLLERDAPSGQIFLMSDGKGYKWSDIIENISSILGIEVRTIIIPTFLLYIAAIFYSIINYVKRDPFILTIDKLKEVFKKGWFCDIKDIRKILRYDPEYDLRKGFQLTFEWYKTNRWL